MASARHTFGGSALDRYLIDFDPEIDAGAAGDIGGAPVESGDVEAAAAPAASGTPEAEAAAQTVEPAAAAWTGPSQEEWQQYSQAVAQMADLVQGLQFNPPAGDPAGEHADELPELDPYDPESVIRYFEAREERLLGRFERTVSPLVERTEAEQADEWTQRTFQQVGVPEAEHWRRGTLLTAAAYRTDQYGRPVPPEQAVRAGHQFLQQFAQAERAAEREAVLAEQRAEQERLRNLAGAPATPAGHAGVDDPNAIDDGDHMAAWRRFQARQTASA